MLQFAPKNTCWRMELSYLAAAVTSLITSLAGEGCGSSSPSNTCRADAGGEWEGERGEKDAFVFTLSFWEVIRCSSMLREPCKEQNPSSDGSCSLAVSHFRALLLSCVSRENFSRGNDEKLVTNQHNPEYMRIIKYCKINWTIQKASAFIVQGRTSRTPGNFGTISETQKSWNLDVFPLKAFPSLFSLFSTMNHSVEEYITWIRSRSLGLSIREQIIMSIILKKRE